MNKRLLKKKNDETRNAIIKYRFRWHCRYSRNTYKKYPMMWEHSIRAIMLWRVCQLLWTRKSYTNRLYSLTPDHINFHKELKVCKY